MAEVWTFHRVGCSVTRDKWPRIVCKVSIGGLSSDAVEKRGRLIAAAPELLAALKTLVSDLEDYAASERPVYAVELARAAIAKAEAA